MMDIEFTIERGKLYCSGRGGSGAFAAIRIAVDMVRERLIGPGRAAPVEPEQLNQLLRPILPRRDEEGVPGEAPWREASSRSGRRTGRVVFTQGCDRACAGRRAVILVRIETSRRTSAHERGQGILTGRAAG